MKAIVFGLGRDFVNLREYIQINYDIIAVTDNNPDAAKRVPDMRFIRPDEIVCYDFDEILVTPLAGSDDIRTQLLSLGVVDGKIKLLRKRPQPFILDPDYFSESLSDHEKKALFKRNVEYVDLELNSKCNRRCWFCPNSFLDRHSSNEHMSDSTLDKILCELEEIGFNGDMTLAYYNEPLLCDDLEDKIRKIKTILPRVRLHFVTNGDYLTAGKVKSLEDAGMDRILVSCYIANDKQAKWDYETAKEFILAKANSLGGSVRELLSRNDMWCLFVGFFGKLNIYFQSQNFNVYMNNRAGLMSSVTESEIKRNKICVMPYSCCHVLYSGDLTFCCQMHTGAEEHMQFIIGNCNENTIFDIWSSDYFRDWRKKILCDLNSYPCTGCALVQTSFTWNIPNTPDSIHPFARMTRKELDKYASLRFS